MEDRMTNYIGKIRKLKKMKSRFFTRRNHLKDILPVTSSSVKYERRKNEIVSLDMKIDKIDNDIEECFNNMELVDFFITDHALLRYIQRKMNINIEKVRVDMLRELTQVSFDVSEGEDVKIVVDDYVYVKAGNAIVTCYENE